MTTGHTLPGYGNYERKLKRAASAHPVGTQKLDDMYTKLDRQNLQDIKKKAFEEWAKPNRSRTTYGHFHHEKDFDGKAEARPRSPTRRNKPHPSLVFLTNRLHYVPGFTNADASMGKPAYRVDGGVPMGDQVGRDKLRQKFQARPHTAAVLQQSLPIKHELEMRGCSPWEAQAAEAWHHAANDRDRKDLEAELAAMEQNFKMESPAPLATPAPAALHRFMKHAGAEEATRIKRIAGHPEYTFNPGQRADGPKPATYVTQLRSDDIRAMRRKPMFQYRPHRGDFLLHPDWPPTLPQHALPDWPVQQPERPRYVYHNRKLIEV